MKKLLFCLFAVLSTAICICTGCASKIPEKPDDTTLEFWIAQDVSSVDFSEYYARADIFGANEYYGKGYFPEEITDGNEDILPRYYVLYTVGGYPDTSDDWNYVTRILITDPDVNVYGITCDSTLSEFDGTMKELGYKVHEDSATMHSATKGKVRFCLVSYDGQNNLMISVEVTNRRGVVY